MKAMILDSSPGSLRPAEVEAPVPGPGQVLLKVLACGVCRTDLHLIEGDLEQPKLPLIPGHQIVATVEANGPGADRFEQGERVGVRPETVVYPLERAQEALEDLRDGRAEGSLVLQVA